MYTNELLTFPHQAATSFECDGCAHHASFHSMESPADEATVAKWNELAGREGGGGQVVMGAARKRKKIAAVGSGTGNGTGNGKGGNWDVVEVVD